MAGGGGAGGERPPPGIVALWRAMLEHNKRVPPELAYIQEMAVGGVSVSYQDMAVMDAITWADWKLWKRAQAEWQRQAVEDR